MIIEDKINSLIGKQYDAVNYHCWHLVMDLQPNVPHIDIIASKTAGVRHMNDGEYSNWEVTQHPKDLDVCLLGNREDALHHAGVYFKGSIIHNDLTTVRSESLDTIKTKYKCIKYYTEAKQ